MIYAETQRFFNEPEERLDPRERLLDAFDALLEALAAADIDPQVRARFANRFPPLFDAPGDSPAGSRPPSAEHRDGGNTPAPDAQSDAATHAPSGRLAERESEGAMQNGANKINLALGFANAIDVCRQRLRGTKPGPAHAQAEVAVKFLVDELTKLRSAR